MNKSIAILASLVVLGSAASSMAANVAVVDLSSYGSLYGNFQDRPIYSITAGTLADPATTLVQLVAKANPGDAWTTVQVGGDATKTTWGIYADGNFDAGNVGVIPGATAGATLTFELRAWTGAAGSTWENATVRGQLDWSQATGTWDNAANPPATPPSVMLALPGNLTLNGVPEPSTIALGMLGAAALLLRRRK